MSLFVEILLDSNNEKLSNIFPNLRRDTLITLIEKLQSILLDDITKTEINSYVLLEE